MMVNTITVMMMAISYKLSSHFPKRLGKQPLLLLFAAGFIKVVVVATEQNGGHYLTRFLYTDIIRFL